MLTEFVLEYEQATRRLVFRCRRLLPEPHGSRVRSRIGMASRRLRLYKYYSEAGTCPCPESYVQARQYRARLLEAAETCAQAITEQESAGVRATGEQVKLAQDLARWCGRKVPTFPDQLNLDTFTLGITTPRPD